jgi:hypothetical protein
MGLLWMALLLAFSSCNQFQRLDKRSKLIAASKEGVIRGVNFDISPDSVKKLETLTPDIDQDGFLSYSLIPKDFPNDTLKVDYMFNSDNQLDIIAIDYKTNDQEGLKDITENLREFFQKRYGEGRQDELGWNTWDFKDTTTAIPGTIEIVLLIENDPDYQGVKLELVKYFEEEQ